MAGPHVQTQDLTNPVDPTGVASRRVPGRVGERLREAGAPDGVADAAQGDRGCGPEGIPFHTRANAVGGAWA